MDNLRVSDMPSASTDLEGWNDWFENAIATRPPGWRSRDDAHKTWFKEGENAVLTYSGMLASLGMAQQGLSVIAAHAFSRDDLVRVWLLKDIKQQRSLIMGVLVAIQEGRETFIEERMLCDEVTLRNLLSNGGLGFLRLLRSYIFEDPLRPLYEPVFIQSARFDTLYNASDNAAHSRPGISRKEYDSFLRSRFIGAC